MQVVTGPVQISSPTFFRSRGACNFPPDWSLNGRLDKKWTFPPPSPTPLPAAPGAVSGQCAHAGHWEVNSIDVCFGPRLLLCCPAGVMSWRDLLDHFWTPRFFIYSGRSADRLVVGYLGEGFCLTTVLI